MFDACCWGIFTFTTAPPISPPPAPPCLFPLQLFVLSDLVLQVCGISSCFLSPYANCWLPIRAEPTQAEVNTWFLALISSSLSPGFQEEPQPEGNSFRTYYQAIIQTFLIYTCSNGVQHCCFHLWVMQEHVGSLYV